MMMILVMFLVMMMFLMNKSVLQNWQTPDATPQQIKKAYYNCMKACHPDLSGDDPDTVNFCKFINEVYGVMILIYFCMI